MLKCFLTVIAVMVFGSAAFGQAYYGSTDMAVFRNGRDKEFRDKEQSPLKPADLAKFSGLNYFPADKRFRVKAAFRRTAGEKYFLMPTSSGVTKKFVKFGELSFRLLGRPQMLSVYQIDPAVLAKFPEYADLLFVPFRDPTNGKETYGVGRYIDIEQPRGKFAILDFNLAYNPNCAYGNDKYSCPIPPKENVIDVAVAAGEKLFPHTVDRSSGRH
jgi:uncharacterized protein (DUF1684 family)